MSIIDEIRIERERQIKPIGWTADHDDTLANGELTQMACAYALDNPAFAPPGWAFKADSGRRRELIKAAALIVAEIERLDRSRRQEEFC